ncbi:MAG: hypothetical protein HY543_11995 [Deltaproteobacteria bacterium]|nr:hypothetical protein [Deltaproteobacteria bacterium]
MTIEQQIADCAESLGNARFVTVLTGAGVSAESGVATFRDAHGLWEGVSPETVATPGAFQRDPACVRRFYAARRGHSARLWGAAVSRHGRTHL